MSVNNKENELLFRKPEPSYCFNAAEPVTFWIDNTYDEHQFHLRELCEFEHEWEKEELVFDDDNHNIQTFSMKDIETALTGVVDEEQKKTFMCKLRKR